MSLQILNLQICLSFLLFDRFMFFLGIFFSWKWNFLHRAKVQVHRMNWKDIIGIFQLKTLIFFGQEVCPHKKYIRVLQVIDI